jgi:hypothetical protein
MRSVTHKVSAAATLRREMSYQWYRRRIRGGLTASIAAAAPLGRFPVS